MDMTNGMAGGSMLDLADLLQNSVKGNNNGWLGGNGDGSFLLLFLLILFGGWGNGYGNRGQAGQLTNDRAVAETVDAAIQKARADGLSDQVIIEAVKGNGTAINQLATTLNCDMNSIKTVLGSLDKSILQVGNQLGMSTQQIINAVQSGNCETTRAIENCLEA